jgi:hypothetical protein
MFAVSIVRPVSTALFHPAGPATVTDAAGVTWNVAALYGTCALAAIFAMGAFAVLALLRFTDTEPRSGLLMPQSASTAATANTAMSDM